jgi:PAS domain S-box-containing protein
MSSTSPAPPLAESTQDEPRAEVLDRLREGSARLEVALSVSQLGTYEWNVRTQALILDQRSREIFGFAPDQGHTVEEVYARIHPADRAWVRDLVQARIARGERVDSEYRLELPDGRVRFVASSGQMTRGEDGATEKVFGVFADVTANKEADRALRDSEAKFRTIANAMPQMVWSTLPDGYHDYYNQQWYEYTGMPPGSTDGERWNGMFHPEDQAHAWSVWNRSLRTGEPYEIQYRLRHRSGEYRWVLGRALPVRDEAGQIIRWMGTCTDIHDQRMAQDELMAANRRKDEFLAMLAHELRNPLAPISTAAHLLKLAPSDAARVARSGDIIARQVKHMTALVDDLLDVSRVTRGLVNLHREPTDLHGVLSAAVEQARPLLEARGHELAVQADPAPSMVLGDRTRLVQVVSNLLNNAAKFTPQNGRVTLGLRLGDAAEISVGDNGIGIEPELLPHVFDLFIQGKRTPDRAQGGLGLGLALSRSLVELHRGSIRAESAGRGQGSLFTVRLPLLAQQRTGAPGDDDERATSTRRSVRVLVVDDNVDAAESLAVFLQNDGHQARVATDPHTALKQAAAQHPEVVILDIGLPEMDGYELARRLRSEPATERATFVALTGYGQEHDKLRSIAAGFDHHCVKPANLPQLLQILQQASDAQQAAPAER